MPMQRVKKRRKPTHISYDEFREAALANSCCGQTIGSMAEHIVCLARDTIKNASPVYAFEELLSQIEGLPVHGFWHHMLPGQVLLSCLQNAGYQIAQELIDEAIERGRLTPPGSCGFLGPCGALVSATAAYSILLGSTPVATDRREKILKFYSQVAAQLAHLDGNRCCKKSSYVAFEVACEEFSKIGFDLPKEYFHGRCRYFSMNETCDGDTCVYFPTRK